MGAKDKKDEKKEEKEKEKKKWDDLYLIKAYWIFVFFLLGIRKKIKRMRRSEPMGIFGQK